MKGEVTELLLDWKAGDQKASEAIFPLVYARLKEIAHAHIIRERNDLTFQKTDLVHEVFLKMIDQTRIEASDRNHFYSIASRCMRQILVDYARKKNSKKRGSGQKAVTLDENLAGESASPTDIIRIDEALDKLAELDERMSKVTELHFFGGLSIPETADVLGVSTSTIDREWKKAKLWLYQFISEQKE
ncbi:ECF-type sigma factor [Gracilimonas sp.]|uniref:ECF-type sigma factor n=1 Tax=Gracilimonas sp. TaxID=1974203 RepID=UPI003D123309